MPTRVVCRGMTTHRLVFEWLVIGYLRGIRRCGIVEMGVVGGSMSLEGGLWDFKCSSQALSLSLMPADLDIEYSNTSPAPYLLVCCHVFCHDGNRLNL